MSLHGKPPAGRFLGAVLVAAAGLLRAPARGDDATTAAVVPAAAKGLESLSLEELMNVEVTSVSRKEQKLSESAAAVYVITQEDIRRSGLHSIPELLRMAPGIEVARIDANKWAISSRGFNSAFANKLLVLVDGRSVYSPLVSGVYWDVQDTLIEDVERIEVIRGPGATLWGANAVNGVINIITKKAADTQGTLVAGGGGSEELGSGALRHGGKIGEAAHFRVYGKYFLHDDFVDAAGSDAADEWDMLRGGFRLDWAPAAADAITLQGDIYAGSVGSRTTIATVASPFSSTFNDAVRVSGGNVLGRWTHTFSEASQAVLQLYYDRTDRNEEVIQQVHDTFDADFQHRFRLASWNDVIWGLGYRAVLDRLEDGPSVTADPHRATVEVVSGFLQDETRLFGDSVRLTIGTKLEQNDFSGFEVQPSGRILWRVNESNVLWAAASRAVRTPSRAEHDIRINTAASPGLVVAVRGNNDFDSEDLTALELGYRVHPLDRWSIDVAGFYNEYDNLLTATPRTPFFEASPPPPHLVAPVDFDNNMTAETFGVEIASSLKVTDWWRLSGGYTFLRMQLHEHESATNDQEAAEDRSPRNQAHLRSYVDLPWDLELDALLYYVENLPSFGIRSYLRLDARLGWRPTRDLEVSIGVQNILDGHHPEFGAETLTNPSEVERAFYGKVTWRF